MSDAKSLVLSAKFFFVPTLEAIPALNSYLQLSPMPNGELKVHVWGLMICDFLGAFAVEVVSTFLFYASACTSATDRLLK